MHYFNPKRFFFQFLIIIITSLNRNSSICLQRDNIKNDTSTLLWHYIQTKEMERKNPLSYRLHCNWLSSYITSTREEMKKLLLKLISIFALISLKTYLKWFINNTSPKSTKSTQDLSSNMHGCWITNVPQRKSGDEIWFVPVGLRCLCIIEHLPDRQVSLSSYLSYSLRGPKWPALFCLWSRKRVPRVCRNLQKIAP